MKLSFILSAILCGLLCGSLNVQADESKKTLDQLQPLITTAELVVGTNRFAFGLLNGGKLLEDAEVTLRLYSMDGSEAKLTADVKVPYRAVNKLRKARTVHHHADGSAHVHSDGSFVTGLYVTRLSFARAGDWGVEVRASTPNGGVEIVRFAITVQESSPTPAVGSAAPRSRNLIADDVKNLREIDTSPKPDARLHRMRIADAIAQGRPQLIVFATPQFCTSRMCGPVLDIVRTLFPGWRNRVAFIHQEIWQDISKMKMFATVEEWRLETEPWVFTVDGQGIIRARFEGLVTEEELEIALQQMVTAAPNRRR